MLSRSTDKNYIERKAKSDDHNYKYIIGVDEAGRGPLAGPVVAGATLFLDFESQIEGICDSKATTEEERVGIYSELIKSDKLIWDVGIISHEEIDEINILQATMKAMRTATEKVMAKAKARGILPNQCYALIDGNRVPIDMPVTADYVIKGDANVYCIAAASIIAKYTRDEIMHELDKQYPEYGFSQHKGYPTAQHVMALNAHGASPVHRTTYRPVKDAINRKAAAKAKQSNESNPTNNNNNDDDDDDAPTTSRKRKAPVSTTSSAVKESRVPRKTPKKEEKGKEGTKVKIPSSNKRLSKSSAIETKGVASKTKKADTVKPKKVVSKKDNKKTAKKTAKKTVSKAK